MPEKPVYSTDQGELCPECGRPIEACLCEKNPAPRRNGETVRVGRQTQGRKGKGVTVITGLPLPDADLLKFATELKRKCGSGGTVKDGVIEIQGDHRDLLVKVLAESGYRVRRSGG